MRVLTDPAETGAVTLALPQDVQAEARDWPDELFTARIWYVPRPVPEPAALARAAAVIRSGRQPADRGRRRRDLRARRAAALRQFAEATGIPVADTQAGKGALAWRPPAAPLGARRRTGIAGGQPRWPAQADVVHRHRHPVQRLHHRVAHRVRPTRTCASST